MSARHSAASQIANRYAKALFQLAKEQQQLDAVASQLGSIASALKISDELQHVLNSPVLARNEITKTILAVAEKLGADAATRNMLGVMGQQRRLALLPKVIEKFMAQLAAERGEIAVQVTSARPLQPGQEEKIRAAFGGAKAQLHITIDESLMGGLRVQIGSTVIDSSVRSRLERLELIMKGVA